MRASVFLDINEPETNPERSRNEIKRKGTNEHKLERAQRIEFKTNEMIHSQ